jgi:hypothetical protein
MKKEIYVVYNGLWVSGLKKFDLAWVGMDEFR